MLRSCLQLYIVKSWSTTMSFLKMLGPPSLGPLFPELKLTFTPEPNTLCRICRTTLHDRFAEYGWKPYRMLVAEQQLSQASMYRYVCANNRGARFRTILVQQHSDNLSLQSNRVHREACRAVQSLLLAGVRVWTSQLANGVGTADPNLMTLANWCI